MEINGQYLTFDEYKVLGGTLDKMPFLKLEFEARKEIDKNTFGRLKGLKEQKQEVKLCIYELISLLNSYKTNENQNKSISSESIDGYSVSYNTQVETNFKAKQREVYKIVETYLSCSELEDGTPYLYRG